METVLRVAAIYFFILIALRILGKRDFSQLSPFDLVTLLLIPELSQQAMLRDDYSVTNAGVGLGTLFLLVLFTSMVTHLWPRADEIVSGSPTVLVSHGRMLPDGMNRERVPPSEIFGEMHKAGLYDLSQVRWAILETDGKISFIPYDSPPKRSPAEQIGESADQG